MAGKQKPKESEGKKAKKKHVKCKKSNYYKLDGDKVTKTKKTCPKCGSGVYMAEHKDRYVCGACRYTEWKKKDA